MKQKTTYTEEEGRALLAAVEAWQADEMRHPLTCPDHSDEPLRPFLAEGSTWRVYLFCHHKGCKYSQAWIPVCVYESIKDNLTSPD